MSKPYYKKNYEINILIKKNVFLLKSIKLFKKLFSW